MLHQRYPRTGAEKETATMPPRFTTLYSGSSGNAGVAEEDGKFLLIDMGASCRTTLKGLASLGLSPQNLAGILVTHEHTDHIRGLHVFLKHHPVPVYGSVATLEALWNMDVVHPSTELIAVDYRCEDVEGFVVEGFATSHDAAGCCGFRIKMPGGAKMAIATDLGVVTNDVYGYLRGAQLVALEANYDVEQLRLGPYPYYLKRRIESPRGHLSNEASADVVAALVAEGCKRVALCHLSETNNTPGLVKQAIESALYRAGVPKPAGCVVQVCRRHEASPWIEF